MHSTLQIKTVADYQSLGELPDILFWVGCAGSFDARAQKVTRAFAQILDHCKVRYAILGNEEKCTGDPARRAGNEFLFQMSALMNIEILNQYHIKKIVTACPHCFNTLKNEYPELGGKYEVIHHTQFLKELLDQGILKVQPSNNRTNATYHDSCYLGRANGIYEVPRELLDALQINIREMKKCKSNGLCCGAGGAQMFKEDEPGEKRINTLRIEQAMETESNTIVTNCPFCLTMMEDGVKLKEKSSDIQVFDISELILMNTIVQ